MGMLMINPDDGRHLEIEADVSYVLEALGWTMAKPPAKPKAKRASTPRKPKE